MCRDGSVLACVCGKEVHLFETAALWFHPDSPRPLHVLTISETEDVVDLSFNPGNFADKEIKWFAFTERERERERVCVCV